MFVIVCISEVFINNSTLVEFFGSISLTTWSADSRESKGTVIVEVVKVRRLNKSENILNALADTICLASSEEKEKQRFTNRIRAY
jgi:hypothetical protein